MVILVIDPINDKPVSILDLRLKSIKFNINEMKKLMSNESLDTVIIDDHNYRLYMEITHKPINTLESSNVMIKELKFV